MIGAAGLGREINVARSGGDLNSMYALIVATGLLGWALNLTTTAGERRVLHWHPVPARGGDVKPRTRRIAELAVEIAVPLVILAAIFAWTASTPTFYFPPLSDVFERFAQHVAVRALRIGRLAEPAPDVLGYAIAVAGRGRGGHRARQLADAAPRDGADRRVPALDPAAGADPVRDRRDRRSATT